jgi:hypothetical protein
MCFGRDAGTLWISLMSVVICTAWGESWANLRAESLIGPCVAEGLQACACACRPHATVSQKAQFRGRADSERSPLGNALRTDRSRGAVFVQAAKRTEW